MSRTGCRNGDTCEYKHDFRSEDKQSESETIDMEVKDAITYGNLNNIFAKMLSSQEYYEKYYAKLYYNFRNVAIYKLKNKSIIKDVVDKIELRDITINGEQLRYGFMPLLFHFIMMGFTWHTFYSALNHDNYQEINSCFDELIDQLTKTKVKDDQIPKYTEEEYEEMLLESCDYSNPFTYESFVHVAAHYVCESVIEHVKEKFKQIKRRSLINEFGDDIISNMRSSMTRDEFNNKLSEEFNRILTVKNKENKTVIDVFNDRKESRDITIEKFKYKIVKAEKNRNRELAISEATQRFEYNLEHLDKKINRFSEIFESMNKIIKINNSQDLNELFSIGLSKLCKSTAFGIRCDIEELNKILYIVNTEFKNHKDEYIKRIIDTIPEKLNNSKDVIQKFRVMDSIHYLWNALLNSITIDKPDTFCMNILNVFFEEANQGLRESYLGQYLEKLMKVSKDLSPAQKDVFIKNIMESCLIDEIKSYINF
jgi:hypothetical protein